MKLARDALRTHFYLAEAHRRARREDDARREYAEFNHLQAIQYPVSVESVPPTLLQK